MQSHERAHKDNVKTNLISHLERFGDNNNLNHKITN